MKINDYTMVRKFKKFIDNKNNWQNAVMIHPEYSQYDIKINRITLLNVPIGYIRFIKVIRNSFGFGLAEAKFWSDILINTYGSFKVLDQ